MVHSTKSISIFNQAIDAYHAAGELLPEIENPFDPESVEGLLYRKGWIDSVQWHLEDEVRAPDMSADRGWALKKEIDRFNQWRTDTVEAIDNYIHEELKGVKHRIDARMNSESPGLIIDRLSILALKIFHMREEVQRKDAGTHHVEVCHKRLEVLMEQEEDLGTALDQLMADLMDGKKMMKIYYQMKMYNDKDTNPALYRKR